MICFCAHAFLSITSIACSELSVSSRPDLNMRDQPITAFSGVRSS